MKNKIKYILPLFLTIAIILGARIALRNHITTSLSIGDSMSPTIAERTLDFSTTSLDEIEKDSIYNMREPESGNEITKRVIAVPGDNVKIENGKLYVNGVEDTSVFSDNADYSYSEGLNITIENDCYFVMGDNRNVSVDSRHFGSVRKDYFISKHIFSID